MTGKTFKQALHLVRQQTIAEAQAQRTVGIPCSALSPEKSATCVHSRCRTNSPLTVFPASPVALHGTSSAVSTFQHMGKFHFSLRFGLAHVTTFHPLFFRTRACLFISLILFILHRYKKIKDIYTSCNAPLGSTAKACFSLPVSAL